MSRRTKRELLDEWIRTAYPDGITKLANRSGIPASSISKIRTGRVPKSASQRQLLAKALGVSEDDLFPVLHDGNENAAS